eukprot:Em0006g1207a
MSDIQARLKIRDDERKAAAYQKKQERDDRRTDDETSDHFSKECASRRARIEDLLQAATALPKNELPDHFECISKEMQALQKFSISGQDVNLSKLTRCSVRLPETPSTLHMSELVGCTILCGPVSSSVFVDSCTDCTIVVVCQQATSLPRIAVPQFHPQLANQSNLSTAAAATLLNTILIANMLGRGGSPSPHNDSEFYESFPSVHSQEFYESFPSVDAAFTAST